MTNLPSKELLSAVVGFEVTKFPVNRHAKKILFYSKTHCSVFDFVTSGDLDIGSLFSINTHELAHMVKEWAMTKGFILYSSVYGFECYIDGRKFTDYQDVRFFSGTEPEAIFKAGEWILKETSK